MVRVTGHAKTYMVLPDCDVPKGVIAENRRLEFIVEVDGRPPDHRSELYLNDIALPRFTRGGKTVFLFENEFFAGDLRIAIIREGEVLSMAEVEVDADLAKLTRDEYATMVSETSRATLALYRLGVVTMPASTSANGLRCDVVTLELIRTNFVRFERAVSRIADHPVRLLESMSEEVDVARARRIDDRTILAALRSPHSRAATVAELASAPGLVGALGGRWAPRLRQTKREETVDAYENRVIVGFMRWLRSVIADLTERFSVGATVELPAGTEALWSARVSRWRNRIANLERRSIFSGLRPEHGLRATSVFRMHPDYAAAFSAMSRMRAGLGVAGLARPNLSVDRTYRLYEIWCYVSLLAAAASVFPNSRARIAEVLRGCEDGRAFGMVLAQGGAGNIPLEETLILTYQRRVTRKPAADGVRTPLVEAIPDIALSRLDPSGRCTGMVVLDPKYRSGSSLNAGVQDLHAYRDSILGYDDKPVVRGAVVMAPRPSDLPILKGAIPLNMPAIAEVRPAHDQGVFERLLTRSVEMLSSTLCVA